LESWISATATNPGQSDFSSGTELAMSVVHEVRASYEEVWELQAQIKALRAAVSNLLSTIESLKAQRDAKRKALEAAIANGQQGDVDLKAPL
jgi:hypothetical protein